MADFGVYYPPWNHSGDLLDRAVGEVGVRHITVPAVHGPVRQLRIAPAAGPHELAIERGWSFPSRGECYAAASLKPRPSSWFGRRDTLGAVCEAAGERSVRVYVRIDLLAALGRSESETAVLRRNAWGEPAPPAGACPLNPEVRELLSGTIEDLMRYELAGVTIPGWLPDAPADRAQPRPMDWSPVARRLLDTCFCPACRQVAAMAGIDPDQAARSCAVHAERALCGDDAAVEASVRDDEVLSAYARIRTEANRVWLHALIERRAALGWRLECDADDAPHERPQLPPRVEWIVRLPRRAEPFGRHAVAALRQRFAGAVGVSLHAWRPSFSEGHELVHWVHEAGEHGLEIMEFRGVDEAMGEAFDWLRQAVRFARRDT